MSENGLKLFWIFVAPIHFVIAESHYSAFGVVSCGVLTHAVFFERFSLWLGVYHGIGFIENCGSLHSNLAA